MKHYILLIFLWLPIVCLGQCKVYLKIHDSCIECENKLSYTVSLTDSTGAHENSKGVNILKKGNAHAWININRCDQFKLLYFDFEVPNSDELHISIVLPKLMEMSTFDGINPHGDHHFYFWCNELANGEVVDYYEDDKVRIRGEFMEGKPIGKLTTYLRNGHINFVAKYTRKGRFKRLILYNYDFGKKCSKSRHKVGAAGLDILHSDRGAYGGFVGFNPEYTVK
ncbi:hypothetical protein EYV94_27380 [Puteibacter caeruleilacunae]|nr:hypothetical protein EYV94_27380 [Puteibacter caeruleilacunae]